MTNAEFKAALQSIGWSQAEFARRTDYAPNTISRWLAGEMPIPRHADAHLEALCAIKRISDELGIK